MARLSCLEKFILLQGCLLAALYYLMVNVDYYFPHWEPTLHERVEEAERKKLEKQKPSTHHNSMSVIIRCSLPGFGLHPFSNCG